MTIIIIPMMDDNKCVHVKEEGSAANPQVWTWTMEPFLGILANVPWWWVAIPQTRNLSRSPRLRDASRHVNVALL